CGRRNSRSRRTLKPRVRQDVPAGPADLSSGESNLSHDSTPGNSQFAFRGARYKPQAFQDLNVLMDVLVVPLRLPGQPADAPGAMLVQQPQRFQSARREHLKQGCEIGEIEAIDRLFR